MHNRNLGPFFSQLVGTCGIYLPEAGTADKLICHVLFRTYYKNAKEITYSVALKQLNGTSPIPRHVWRFYTKEDAWQSTYSDVEHMIALCSSITRARIIQQRVHDWLPESGLPGETVMELERHYTPNGNLHEITSYLAHVRHQLMTA